MKNILLTAKFLASKEGVEKIKLDHIKKALKSIVLVKEEYKEETYDKLGVNYYEKNQLITEEELVAIANKSTMYPDEEAKSFIDYLKSIGLNKSITISKLYYENKNDVFSANSKKLIAMGDIKTHLQSIVYDQEIAIEAVKDTISRAIFEEREDAVKAILFFVGPPATGKTFLSEETGKILKDFGYTTKVFNMTMYSDDHSNLTGLTAPYSGAGRGDLTKFIEQNPKSLIIFDEIEKCNLQKQQDLFRLLDRGYVEDKYDNSVVKANDCILIFTSNLGKSIYEREDYSSMIQNQQETESLILNAIAKEKNEKDPNQSAITPPLTSRLSAAKIVLFNKVGLAAYYKMSKKEIERYFGVVQEKFGVNLECSNDAIVTSFLKYLPFFDPRRIKGKIGDDLFDHLRDAVQQRNLIFSDYKKIVIDVKEDLKELLSQNFIKNIETLEFNDERFLELIDKKQTLFVDAVVEAEGDAIKLLFTNPKIEKIKNIQDFDGDVKIELGIPLGKIEGEPNAKIFGHDDAKKMLVRISNKIQLFQELRRKNDPKAKEVLKNIPKGILLYGPPGTGKTKIARAFAAQVECPIIVSSGKDMTTMQFVGTGVQKIKDIFAKAREYAPSVLFIDEIDAIGQRGGSESSQENNKNINTLLEELDGFSKDEYKPVFIIAATNRKEVIDPAIIRPGRIEEHIEIGHLDKNARMAFTKDMFENDSDFSSDIDPHKFIKYTVGMSGAQIEQVFKKAKYNLEIKREEKNNTALQIDLETLIDIVNDVRYGAINKSRVDAKFENMLTAYHEAGHAIVSLVLNTSVVIEQITVTPRADFGGFVSYNHEDIHRWDKDFMIGKIASAYGGRVAEELYFLKERGSKHKGVSSGASEDIKQATKLIQEAVLRLGMDDELGLINYTELSLSEQTKSKIDQTILKWQGDIKSQVEDIINKNWENVEKIVLALVGDDENEGAETLDGEWLSKNIKINRGE